MTSSSPAPAPARSRVPRPGRIGVRRVAAVPRPGALATAVVARRRPAGSILVPRVVEGIPVAGSLAPEVGGGQVGRSDAGRITVEDRVVMKIASRAAAENPDAGGVAARVFGTTVPGLTKLGGRDTSLGSLPKITGEVDGIRAFLRVELSVRYPAPIAEVTDAVRRTIIDRLHQLAGIDAIEVEMVVRALLTDLPAPPRVR